MLVILFNQLDINECSRDLHSCETEKKQCVNTVGSYKCECKAGYQGDGKTCIGE